MQTTILNDLNLDSEKNPGLGIRKPCFRIREQYFQLILDLEFGKARFRKVKLREIRIFPITLHYRTYNRVGLERYSPEITAFGDKDVFHVQPVRRRQTHFEYPHGARLAGPETVPNLPDTAANPLEHEHARVRRHVGIAQIGLERFPGRWSGGGCRVRVRVSGQQHPVGLHVEQSVVRNLNRFLNPCAIDE